MQFLSQSLAKRSIVIGVISAMVTVATSLDDIGDLDVLVIDPQKYVGFSGDLPFVRDGNKNSVAIGSNMTMGAEYKSVDFRLSVKHTQILYNISVRVFGPIAGSASFHNGEKQLTGHLNGEYARDLDVEIYVECGQIYDSEVSMQFAIEFLFREFTVPPASTPHLFNFTLYQRKQCFSAAMSDSGSAAAAKASAPLGSGGSYNNATDLFKTAEPSLASTSVFFISVGISCGVIFVIAVVVAFYHVRTFRPQQRKSQQYREVPFAHENPVPMFEPSPTAAKLPPSPLAPVPHSHSFHMYPHPMATTALNNNTLLPGQYPLYPQYMYPNGMQPAALPPQANLLNTSHSTSDSKQRADGRRSPKAGINQPGDRNSQSILQAREMLKTIALRREQITVQEVLQEGTFGKLCHGFIVAASTSEPHHSEVFIKAVTNNASPTQVDMMLREGCKFKNIQYKYILSVAAAVLDTDEGLPPMLVYPFSANGNLKLFLQQLRQNRQPLTTKDVVNIAIQICKAMKYLAGKNMVVGDLATRNCVIDERYGIRVTDSALARDIFPEDYQCLGDNNNRPVKWLAPEALTKYIQQSPGDVWSFGVTVWELCTFAAQPYLETDPFEMVSFLKAKNRLYQPPNCPDELYCLMDSCWKYDAEERPHINKLLTYLQDFYKTLGAFI